MSNDFKCEFPRCNSGKAKMVFVRSMSVHWSKPDIEVCYDCYKMIEYGMKIRFDLNNKPIIKINIYG